MIDLLLPFRDLNAPILHVHTELPDKERLRLCWEQVL